MISAKHHWALLGGTFDPVHIGHIRSAIHLLENGFDQVHMIPNAQPPHKSHTGANASQRQKMLELSLNAQKNILINPVELEHSGQSYTVDTLKRLRNQDDTPEKLTWILGSDAWLGLNLWHKADELLDLANLLIINRPQTTQTMNDWHIQKLNQHQCEFEQLLKSSCNKIAFLNLPQLDVSSSQLKDWIKQGKSIRYLVPERVMEFIQQQELYKP